jgi:hypothetical protein
MKLSKTAFILSLICLFSAGLFAQTNTKIKPVVKPDAPLSSVRTSPAYSEIVLRKTELLSDIESLLVTYTEDFPKIREGRYEAALLQKELDRLLAANFADASRLSAALGRLIVRKCEVATDLWSLQSQFNNEHPDVKRAKRKFEIFEAAVNDILSAR